MYRIEYTLFNKKIFFACLAFILFLLWLYVSTHAGYIYLFGIATQVEITGSNINEKVIIKDKETIEHFLNLTNDAVKDNSQIGLVESIEYPRNGGENWYLVLLRRSFPFKDINWYILSPNEEKAYLSPIQSREDIFVTDSELIEFLKMYNSY
ncbi:MAG: hypothetical protein JJT76_19675 [Clostridiaceae bacterium]|nr:hypothetical protein [Clostridiaceae bacterium]